MGILTRLKEMLLPNNGDISQRAGSESRVSHGHYRKYEQKLIEWKAGLESKSRGKNPGA